MRTFTPPPTTTHGLIGEVGLDYAFKLQARFEPRTVTPTLRGGRVQQSFESGTISGPKLQGEVHPGSGGEFGLIRDDGVEDLLCRFMIRAANGEWLYASHVGYRWEDGYYRFQAAFDADVQGPHAWLNETVFVGAAQPDGADGMTFVYFEMV